MKRIIYYVWAILVLFSVALGIVGWVMQKNYNPAGDTMCIKKGKVIRSEYADTYCSPFYYIQMDDAREFMHNLAGFGHHQVLIFGDYTKMIKKIAKIMNFNILEG